MQLIEELALSVNWHPLNNFLHQGNGAAIMKAGVHKPEHKVSTLRIVRSRTLSVSGRTTKV